MEKLWTMMLQWMRMKGAVAAALDGMDNNYNKIFHKLIISVIPVERKRMKKWL